MPLALKEQIAAALATRLATITTGGGYDFTVAGVERPTWEDGSPQPAHQKIILEQGPRSKGEVFDGDVLRIEYIQEFNISLYWKENDGATTAIDTAINLFQANVEKCLMSDQTFGGLAWKTSEVGDPEPWQDADSSFYGITVVFAVHYRHKENDPFNAA